MTIAIRHVLLRANATFLLAASAGGFASDVRGIFFGLGPVARLVADAPYAGLGFIEAHGLAFILGILMWRAQPARGWHLAAAAIHVLLGTANLVFWQLFIVSDMLLVGYVTTALHGLFVVLQMAAAISARMPNGAAAHAGPVSSGHR
ncbi:hypothetical protein KIP88_04485 [Bradyrhizobium sp. SRL28]|uniref:hypothetical protein n=1 Tax=Bradyrhizobium sp. SRL28 TaxID=2836178 RepID=UPI001BDE4236|nr:hypothetical protein [Bradyrhizobium sp. SRL28]MBT1509750.1 hypothetical protein [Bradyrhizobium sp. SRL28]